MEYLEQCIEMMKTLTVSELNNYIKNIINDDYVLNNIQVEGEISNIKLSYGNFYFNLKDENSSIACIIFANIDVDKNFLKEGSKVKIYGKVSVYEKQGRYAVYINKIENIGLGKIYEELEKLKKELYERGMFDPMYKKNIPKYANKIGIVTAKNGAAIKDIMKTMTDKNPYVEAYLYPAIVQGDRAKDSIVRGIEILDKMGLDVIIVGRGGGSKDDLNCFNTIEVAYAIFNAKTPIISAVGHEIDITIADMVADIRVPTPTAAGNIATFDYFELIDKFDDYITEIKNIIEEKIEISNERIEIDSQMLTSLSPFTKISEQKNLLLYKSQKLKSQFYNIFDKNKNHLNSIINDMKYIHPYDRLKKGMAYVKNKKNHFISSIKEVDKEEKLDLIFKDGIIKVIVKNIKSGR